MALTPGTPADGIVLFGATGDLARKRLFPALYLLAAHEQLEVPIVGVAASSWNDDELRDYACSAVEDAITDLDSAVLTRLLGRLAMVSGDYRDPASFAVLDRRLQERDVSRPVHYLAIPPALFGTVVESLAGAGLARDARVVVDCSRWSPCWRWSRP